MTKIKDALDHRFGPDAPDVPDLVSSSAFLGQLAARRSHRDFKSDKLDPELVRSLCALALCAPAKSDMQQRDIVIVENADQRAKLMDIIPGNRWMLSAPSFLVFCANNRRQRQIGEWREKPFVNDHLDAFFNASVDAGIALATFIAAAESIGLGCCPVSAIRDKSREVSDLLELPDNVFAIVGLALGWPLSEGKISMRLPLATTVHTDRFCEDDIAEQIDGYDTRREKAQPFSSQRYVSDYGETKPYGWSEDKARQYSKLERPDFGAFIREKKFDLS